MASRRGQLTPRSPTSAWASSRPGFRADLTVIDRDLFEVKPADLLASKVIGTIIEGEVVFGLEKR